MKTCTKCGATMAVRDTNKFACEFCGNTVQVEQKASTNPLQQPIRERKVVMDTQKIDMFVGLNSKYFNARDLMIIKQKLEQMDDSKFYLIQDITFQNPTTILILAILLGIERFWLYEIGLGILKILSLFFCIGLIWYVVDIFTAIDRAKKYNFKKFTEATMMV